MCYTGRMGDLLKSRTVWIFLACAAVGFFAVGSASAAMPPPVAQTEAPLAIVCDETLSFSDSNPTVGDTIDVTFNTNCRCDPIDVPDSTCSYGLWVLGAITAPGFDVPTTPIGPSAPKTIQITATAVGPTDVKLSYFGYDRVNPPGGSTAAYRSASATIEIRAAGNLPTPTPTPPPTPTPEPTNVRILCHEFLTFSDSNPTVGETIEVTFNANCRCEPVTAPNSTCTFAEFELSRISAPGFDVPDTPIGPPGPRTVPITATAAGRTEVTMSYYGEDYVEPPGYYIWTTRSASAVVDVEEAPAPAAGTSLTIAESCLAGNGRVDFNIVNAGASAAQYRIEFNGLSPRQVTVAPADWARVPITGRPDGQHRVVIRRDGNVIHDGSVEFSCDAVEPEVSSPEISIVNACRNGLGYLLFQIVNRTSSAAGYVITFENVPNRSTTAASFGQAVRAVTGRGEGDHAYTVRRDGAVIMADSVTVDCD